VARHLRRAGYRVLLRNVQTPAGEIDLLALKKGVLHFVEVKARRPDGRTGPGHDALTNRKLARVARAADEILRRRGLAEAPRALLGASVDLRADGTPADVHLLPVEEIR
jgi:Holliday junction resolvase-like predicted endonuclease